MSRPRSRPTSASAVNERLPQRELTHRYLWVFGILTKCSRACAPPRAAIADTTALSLSALTRDVSTLANTVVLPLLVDTALLVMRRDPVHPDHFRASALIPVLGAASSIGLATQFEREVRLRGLAVRGVPGYRAAGAADVAGQVTHRAVGGALDVGPKSCHGFPRDAIAESQRATAGYPIFATVRIQQRAESS